MKNQWFYPETGKKIPVITTDNRDSVNQKFKKKRLTWSYNVFVWWQELSDALHFGQ